MEYSVSTSQEVLLELGGMPSRVCEGCSKQKQSCHQSTLAKQLFRILRRRLRSHR